MFLMRKSVVAQEDHGSASLAFGVIRQRLAGKSFGRSNGLCRHLTPSLPDTPPTKMHHAGTAGTENARGRKVLHQTNRFV